MTSQIPDYKLLQSLWDLVLSYLFQSLVFLDYILATNRVVQCVGIWNSESLTEGAKSYRQQRQRAKISYKIYKQITLGNLNL